MVKVPKGVILEPDEVPIWYSTMSWKAYSLWLVLGLILLPFYFIGALIFLAVVVLINSNEYFISNKRIYAQFNNPIGGNNQSFDIKLNKIQGIIIQQDSLGKTLNYGDIVFKTTGGHYDLIKFVNVSNPVFSKGLLQNIINNNLKKEKILQKLEDIEKEYEFGRISKEKYLQLKSKYEEELKRIEYSISSNVRQE
jgi:hypothetical protein